MTETSAAIGSAAHVHGLRVVVMGVSGSGKTAVGELLGQRLGVEYADADSFHSLANRAKLEAGIALTDDDRLPWLHSIGQWLADLESAGGVVSCSALKRQYRDVLRGHAADLELLYCQGSLELIVNRLAGRKDHFMPTSLLRSQFAELEPPEADEDPIVADIASAPDEIVNEFVTTVLRRHANIPRQ